MRRTLVEIQCERCTRKESQEESPATDQKGDALVITAQGTTHVQFGDLCGPCMRTVSALVAQIGRKIDGLSPDRVVQAKAPPSPPRPVEPSQPKAKKKEHPHVASTPSLPQLTTESAKP